jgi:hypothetical protein
METKEEGAREKRGESGGGTQGRRVRGKTG